MAPTPTQTKELPREVPQILTDFFRRYKFEDSLLPGYTFTKETEDDCVVLAVKINWTANEGTTIQVFLVEVYNGRALAAMTEITTEGKWHHAVLAHLRQLLKMVSLVGHCACGIMKYTEKGNKIVWKCPSTQNKCRPYVHNNAPLGLFLVPKK